MKPSTEARRTSNRTVYNRLQRRRLNCSHCPPNRGENAKRQPRPDSYKSHRRGIASTILKGDAN